ncbi:TerB family tellurite resistance protein [Vibrio algivorus]|uniref:TerB family tellurite resistance protein n=1 Tax=Vibrio algivorus TaxID=1667024 RepID=A0A557P8L8_9VIBR|nr:TerB family tellurite resistance protein [Vibrio algivorus]TVO36968.1 TerB family tellurite resistance protein [Vibrio algivorus]
MIQSLKSFFNQIVDGNVQENQSVDTNLAIAALLCQVSQADHSVDEKEEATKIQMLGKLLSLTEADAKTLLQEATLRSENSASLYEFTDQLRDLEHQQRFELIQSMWQVAYADHHLDPIEEAIIRKVAELLYVNHSDFIRAKLSVAPSS